MTPREMFAEARRKGFTISEMLHFGELNIAKMAKRLEGTAYDAQAQEDLRLQREGLAWLKGLAGDSPEDQRAADIGVLDWRFRDGLPFLVTLKGETVAEVTKGGAGGGFYWRVFTPAAHIIASDPEALAARDSLGQDAVDDWGGPYKTRPAAVQRLLTTIYTESVRLFGVDDLMIPPFKLPR